MKADLSPLGTALVEQGEDGGMWQFQNLRVIASWGGGWDHVSVSTTTRTPTWAEMESIRQMFFQPTETVIQIHPPEADYVNHHPYCLHLWRPQEGTIPSPPSWMIV